MALTKLNMALCPAHLDPEIYIVIASIDINPNTEILAVPIDYSKAFNRMLHSNIVTILSDLKQPLVPTCAIKLIK